MKILAVLIKKPQKEALHSFFENLTLLFLMLFAHSNVMQMIKLSQTAGSFAY